MPPEVQATLVAEQEKSERAGKITPLKARQQVGQDDLDQQTPAQPKTASSPRQRGHQGVRARPPGGEAVMRDTRDNAVVCD